MAEPPAAPPVPPAAPGPASWVYEEIKAVREMRFRFHQEQPAADYAQSLAADMLVYLLRAISMSTYPHFL